MSRRLLVSHLHHQAILALLCKLGDLSLAPLVVDRRKARAFDWSFGERNQGGGYRRTVPLSCSPSCSMSHRARVRRACSRRVRSTKWPPGKLAYRA